MMEFVCQRCGKILDMDESLQGIDFSLLDKGEEDLEKIISSQAFIKAIPPPSTPTSISTPTSTPTSPLENHNAKRSFMSSSGSFFSPPHQHHRPPPISRVASSFMEPPLIPDRASRDKNMTGSTFGIKLSPMLPPRSVSSFDVLDHQSSSTPPPLDGQGGQGPQQVPGGGIVGSPNNGASGPRRKDNPNTQSMRLDISRRGTVSGNLKYIRQASKVSLPTSKDRDTTSIKDKDKDKDTPTTPSKEKDTPPPSSKDKDKDKDTTPSMNELLASKLFQMASDEIGVDVPLCGECAKTVYAEVEEEIAMMEAQQGSYTSFIEQLEQKEKKWAQSHDDLETEIQHMEEEEQSLRQQLVACDLQRENQAQEMGYLKGESDKLTAFEERYWQHFDELHVNLSSFLDDRDACRVQTAVLTETLELLKKTHIINEAFHIWHDGHFGTINTFRLGRLPSQPVDWNEINAAWGLAVLLLASMAKKIGFTFSTYKLVPCGSCSKVERTDNSSSYELFGSSDISLGRLFWYRRFDNGMVAFLVCLKEMGDYAESRDKQFKLPYKMEKDKIGDMSIKIQFNNEETWTKSLKYMLTNLKWLLAWIVKTDAEQNSNLIGGGGGSMNGSSTSISNNTNNSSNNNNTTTPQRLFSKLLRP